MADTEALPIIEDAETGASVIAPKGEIDMSRSPVFRATLRQAQDRSPKKLIVDLAEVAYMDSSGLATLVEGMRLSKDSGTSMVLCGLNQQVQAIFEIARLHHFFTIVETREDAIEL